MADAQAGAAPARSELLQLMLAHILAKVDANRNFVIAPQELLALYDELYGGELEGGTSDAQTQQDAVVNGQSNGDGNGDGNGNEAEYEEFFGVGPSATVVSNVLYAEPYAAKRFTRKLKNLQFVLHEPNDGNTGNGNDNDTGNDNEDNDDANRNKKNPTAAMQQQQQTLQHQPPADASSHSHHDHHNHHNHHDKSNELINAVRINSRWAHNFQQRDTHKRQFYMTPQTHVYTDAMRKDDIFPYAELESLNASALELSLQRNRLKMLILLPHAADGLPQLLQQLSANVSLIEALSAMGSDEERWALVAGQSERRPPPPQLRPTLVRCFLPKFHFMQRIDAGAVFHELLNVTGRVATAWGSDWKVTHEAHIAVSEDGIGGLERTMVLFWNAYSSLRSVPLKFVVEHPFFFIVHNRKGIQLLGHLAQLHI